MPYDFFPRDEIDTPAPPVIRTPPDPNAQPRQNPLQYLPMEDVSINYLRDLEDQPWVYRGGGDQPGSYRGDGERLLEPGNNTGDNPGNNPGNNPGAPLSYQLNVAMAAVSLLCCFSPLGWVAVAVSGHAMKTYRRDKEQARQECLVGMVLWMLTMAIGVILLYFVATGTIDTGRILNGLSYIPSVQKHKDLPFDSRGYGR